MKDFVIYRVPSLKKVGCTRDFKKIRREKYPGRRVVVLEVIPANKGPRHAGDVEWKYAFKFGYERGSLTPKGRESMSKGGKWKGRKGIAAVDIKKAATIIKKGGAANGRSENNFFRRQLTCPHCDRTSSNGASMMRWHFDNCGLNHA